MGRKKKNPQQEIIIAQEEPKVESTLNEEDQALAMVFLLIREGILTSDWNKISEAYFHVSGERIATPNVSPKLQGIRNLILSNSASAHTPPANKLANIRTKEVEQKGGKEFGKGKIRVISGEEIDAEKEYNEEAAANTEKIRRPAFSGKDPFERFKSENSLFRYNDEVKRPNK